MFLVPDLRSLVPTTDAHTHIAYTFGDTVAHSPLGIRPVLVCSIDDDIAFCQVGHQTFEHFVADKPVRQAPYENSGVIKPRAQCTVVIEAFEFVWNAIFACLLNELIHSISGRILKTD